MNTTARRTSPKRAFPARSGEMREGSGFMSLLKNSATAVALTLIGTLAASLLLTAIIFPTADPARLAVPFAAVLMCVSSLVCGFMAARLVNGSPLAAGLLSGVMLEVFILAVALFIGHGGMTLSPWARVLFFLLIVPLSASGSLIGNMKLPQKRRTTIRRR